MWMEERQLRLQQGLSRISYGANVSYQRWTVWGGLVVLAWIGCVLRLPPPQASRTIWPHIGMMILGASIAGTIKENLSKAGEADQKAKQLSRSIRACQTDDELVKVESTVRQFYNEYAFYSRDRTS